MDLVHSCIGMIVAILLIACSFIPSLIITYLYKVFKLESILIIWISYTMPIMAIFMIYVMIYTRICKLEEPDYELMRIDDYHNV